ncbi:MAG: cache domain-containing protein [Parafilimonas terrae]|nr:cache domain-containing protein [Parafilimonas terrae]
MVDQLINLRLSYRILAQTALMAVMLAVIGVSGLRLYYREMVAERMQSLQAITELFMSYAQDLEGRVQSGALTRDAALHQLTETAIAMRFDGGTNYVAIYGMDGTVLAVPNRKLIGTNQMNTSVNGVRVAGTIIDALKTSDATLTEYMYPRPGREGLYPKATRAVLFKPWDIFIAAGTYTDDIRTAFLSLAAAAGGLILGLGALGALGSILVGRSITRPLDRLGRRMQTLVEGDVAAAVPGLDRADEIGRMSKAVEVFRRALIEKATLDHAVAQEVEAKVRRGQIFDTLTKAFEATAGTLMTQVSAAAATMQATAEAMARTASRTSDRATRVTDAAHATAANVQSVASATEEMASTIQTISGQMTQSSALTNQAAAEAERTDAIVGELADGAEQIGAVASMIAAIAHQTNLLALNATIEAARAGEAGRGFAVVAAEVKALAQQTATATEQITNRIDTVQASTRQAVDALRGIGRTVTEVNGLTITVAAAIEQQSVATGAIAESIAQAAGGTDTVTVNIADVSRVAEETGGAADQVLGAAAELARKSGALSDEIARFLGQVRAA